MESVSEKWGAGRCLCSARAVAVSLFVLCPTHPCLQQGAEMRMRQCLTSLPLSPFCSLSSLFLPATILASCRRHHSSSQALSVLLFALQVLSVVQHREVWWLRPWQGKETLRSFCTFLSTLKTQMTALSTQEMQGSDSGIFPKFSVSASIKKRTWLEQVKLFVGSHGAHSLKVQMFPPCSKG